MKASWRFLSIVLFLGAAVYAWQQWQALSARRSENNQLTLRIQEAKTSAEAAFNRKLTQLDIEVDQLRLQMNELPRLRSQIQALRQATNEIGRLQAENQKLKTAKSNSIAAASATISPPSNVQTGVLVPKENWSFAGYSTPEAALQSALWAMKEGNADVFFSSLSAEEAANIGAEGREKFAARASKEAENFTGYSVLEQETVSPDRVMLKVQMAGRDRTQRIYFNKVGGEWKMSDSKSAR